MRRAHNKAIKYAKENGLIVSFDPNVRLPLFDDHEYLKNVIHEYIQYADILKISDEEVEFIFGNKDIEENLDYLFDQGVKIVSLYFRKRWSRSIHKKCGCALKRN